MTKVEGDAPAQPAQQTMQDAANHAQGIWQDDFTEEQLNIPYKREDNATEETKEDTGTEDKPAETEDTQEEVVDTYTDPEPVVTVEDPGDYKPADYSFEVTLKDGKTVKVSTPEEAEKLADDPDNFETPKQLMDFINKQNKMNRNLDRDREKWEADKKKYDEQTAIDQERQQTVANMESELKYLVNKGLMPKIANEDLNADWSDPEIAKKDGVKEQIALVQYMVKENKVRAKAGVAPLKSMIDAFNAWKLETGQQQEADERKAAGEARKAAGARVAGVAPSAQQPYVPKGIAVGRVLPMRGAAVWDD